MRKSKKSKKKTAPRPTPSPNRKFWLGDARDLPVDVHIRSFDGHEEELHVRPDAIGKWLLAQKDLAKALYPNVPVDKLSAAKYELLMKDMAAFLVEYGQAITASEKSRSQAKVG